MLRSNLQSVCSSVFITVPREFEITEDASHKPAYWLWFYMGQEFVMAIN